MAKVLFFNGSPFHHKETCYTKKNAAIWAKHYRREGLKVRTVRRASTYLKGVAMGRGKKVGKYIWLIYVR